MAMNGTDAAAAIVSAMDADGAFDSIEDATQRAQTRASVQEGLERHCVALVEYIKQNAEVVMPLNVPVISSSTQVQIGVVAPGLLRGSIE